MNSFGVVDWTTDVWHFIVRMLIAIVCGLAIGIERKSRSKEAGIRTHAIVSLASCLFMILSKYLTAPLFSDITGSVFDGDATRIASQVVTGIGFLGAGIIMYRRDVMHGLTTAAGVWATAAIGMAIGGGFVVTGVCATAMILLLQLIFHLPIKAFTTRHIALIKMQVWIENDDILPLNYGQTRRKTRELIQGKTSRRQLDSNRRSSHNRGARSRQIQRAHPRISKALACNRTHRRVIAPKRLLGSFAKKQFDKSQRKTNGIPHRSAVFVLFLWIRYGFSARIKTAIHTIGGNRLKNVSKFCL